MNEQRHVSLLFVWWAMLSTELMKSPKCSSKNRVQSHLFWVCSVFALYFSSEKWKNEQQRHWMEVGLCGVYAQAYKYGIQSRAHKFSLFDVAGPMFIFSFICSINVIFFSLDSILFSTFECDPVASTTPSNENRFLFLLFCRVVFHRLPVSCVLQYEKNSISLFVLLLFFWARV